MNYSIILMDGIFNENRQVYSCGIAYLGSFLRQNGIKVTLFSPNIKRMDEKEAVSEMMKKSPSFIGISLLSKYSYNSMQLVLKYLKEVGYKGFLCLGGHWATIEYEKLLKENPEIDCIVIGDGEETTVELINKLDTDTDWHNVKGVAYRDKNDQVKYSGFRKIRSIDDFPFVAMDFIDELIGLYGKSVRIPIITSRGCYANCSYCSAKKFNKLQGVKPYRTRSISRIVDELKVIIKRYQVYNFSFEDDNFLLPGNP